jgi:hypothetical protein
MKRLLVALSLVAATPAMANDTMAELKTGGLVFVRSDVVTMEKEDLFISLDEVKVAYRFRNTSDEDVEAVVAFPMPDIEADPYGNVAVPDTNSDNFLGFTVEMDGQAITPELEQKAFAAELDVTDTLTAAGLSLNPFADGLDEAIEALPAETKADWVARGMLYQESYDDGSGWQESHSPMWRLKSTYWWRATFPADRPVEVVHRYQPSLGGTVAVSFLQDSKPQEPIFGQYQQKYCMDDSFLNAVRRHAKDAGDGTPPFYETWISYVLTTGANWSGAIQEFKLTVDKGAPENLISFCGSGVRKVGPTTFEMTATDFIPERDIDILILNRTDGR